MAAFDKFEKNLVFTLDELVALKELFNSGGNLSDYIAHLRYQQRHPVDTGHGLSLERHERALISAVATITGA